MKLEIITPVESLFKGNIQSVSVPGKKGKFMVLTNHAPIVSTLQEGEILIVTKDFEEQTIAISGGVIEVKQNNIVVLADVSK